MRPDWRADVEAHADDEWTEESFIVADSVVRLKYLRGNENWSMPRMGLHVWPGARLLLDDMAEHAAKYTRHRSFLVLGAGTGLEGLAFAALCARSEGTIKRTVCLTDGAQMSCDLMADNVALNAQTLQTDCIHVCKLIFGEAKDVEKLPMQSGWDCVVICDSTFSYELVPSVLQTIRWLEPSTLIVCSVTGGAPAFERLAEGLESRSHGMRLVHPKVLPEDLTSRAARKVVFQFEAINKQTIGIQQH